MTMEVVFSAIHDSVRRLTARSSFLDWTADQRRQPGNYIAINNSFVFRDVETNKADECIAIPLAPDGSVIHHPEIVRGTRFTVDFKKLHSTPRAPLNVHPLRKAIPEQLDSIGHLVFLLIGRVHDRTTLEEKIVADDFDTIRWSPAATDTLRVDGRAIVVSQTHDEDVLWQGIVRHYGDSATSPPKGLREAFGSAVDKLQERAVAELEIPPPGATPEVGVTDSIVEVLREQREQYAVALQRHLTGTDTTALNEVLRIAYNFVSDATGYLRLIVSVCDLKPIVLWGTIDEHYGLAEAFRQLPWSRSRTKPSLKNYESTIKDARNSAFHNMFPFRKTLRVSLPGTAIGSPQLQIFSEHAKKKDNQLTYRDKELVDILVEFTRARDRRASERFWQKNLAVMDATLRLFAKTSEFLRMVHAHAG